MSERRKFYLPAVLTFVTGTILTGGDEIQALAEYALGRAVFTHELADRALLERVRAVLIEQHPALAEAEPFEKGDEDMLQYLQAYIRRACAKFGANLSVTRGTEQRTETPVESLQRLAPGKEVEVIVLDCGPPRADWSQN